MNTEHGNPVVRAKRRYWLEFGISMGAYVVMIAASSWVLHTWMADSGAVWRVLVAMSPMVAVAFTLAAIVRHLRAVDELMVRMQMESLAIAGAVTAMAAVTYGLGETEGLPHVSAWWTYTVFMLSWGSALPFVRRRYR